MRSIFSLFARSPFSPLQAHMEKVARCVEKLKPLFKALFAKDFNKVEALSQEISKLEHQADLLKNDIRNHLPKSLFLPIDRGSLLEILTLQDSLADHAEDIAILTTLKPLEIPEDLKEPFLELLNKNLKTFEEAQAVICELHELIEFSFGGPEAEKVQRMVEKIAFKEHEVDLIQRKLLKQLFHHADTLPQSTFQLWLKVIEGVSALSNLSEKLANRIRMTLELK